MLWHRNYVASRDPQARRATAHTVIRGCTTTEWMGGLSPRQQHARAFDDSDLSVRFESALRAASDLQRKLDVAVEEWARLRQALEDIVQIADRCSVSSRRMLQRAEEALMGR